MNARTIIEYILAAIVVLILGSLSGWYFFLRTQSQTIMTQDAARGFEATTPLGSAGGGIVNERGVSKGEMPQAAAPSSQSGFFSRALSVIFGGGTGVSLPSGSTPFSEDATGFADVGNANMRGPAAALQRPPQLWHIQNKPSAGMGFVGSGTDERLLYVERGSGYVFEADLETGEVVRLTNTLMPKIYEALITPDRRVVERSLDDFGNITTFIGSIATTTLAASDATTSARTLFGLSLQKNITRIAIGPDSDALFYFVADAGGTAGIHSEWNGSKQKRMFTSALSSWRPIWLADDRIILVQDAADGVPGYTYELKKDGTLSPLLRALPGLTILPRAHSSALLWGQSAGGVLALFARVSPDSIAVQLPIKTIADKCVWMPGKELVVFCGVPQGVVPSNFLDDWYRGSAHSSDAFWRIDASAGSAEAIYTPETDTSIDIENPIMSSDGSYIAFTNAADKSPWLLRIIK